MELLKFVNSTNVLLIWKICSETITVQVIVMPFVHVQKSHQLVLVLKDVLISSIKLKPIGLLITLMVIIFSISEIMPNSKKS
jgi:hypothetical protein